MAAFMNFLGAMTFTGVAKTITSDIADPFNLKTDLSSFLAALNCRPLLGTCYLVFRDSQDLIHTRLIRVNCRSCYRIGWIWRLINIRDLLKLLKHLLLITFLAFVLGYLIYTIVKIIFKTAIWQKRISNFGAFKF